MNALDVLAGAAFGGAVALYGAWRLRTPRRAVPLILALGAGIGLAIAAILGSAAAFAGALAVAGAGVDRGDRRATLARAAAIGVAYVLSPPVAVAALALLAWTPRASGLHWLAIALGLGAHVALRLRAGDPPGLTEGAIVALALTAGAVISAPIGRWIIGPGPRLAAYVALLMLPALAVLGLAWFGAERLFGPTEITRPLLGALGGALLGGAAALMGLGLLALLSSQEPAKAEVLAMLLVPPTLALVSGAEPLALLGAPVALSLGFGAIVAAQESTPLLQRKRASLPLPRPGRLSPK